MFKCLLLTVLCLFLIGPIQAEVLVDLPLDKQVNIGLGDAISGYSSFTSDSGDAFMRKLLLSGQGSGGYYWGPYIDLVKAGYGPYLDLSIPGTTIEYTARYFQGNGNTNPYYDAPIFVYLTDVNEKSGGLGISYGSQPNPTYPSWITCTDDMTTGDYPTDSGFDISKVARVSFWGTDWSGVGNDFIDIKNLKVTNPLTYNVNPIKDAKSAQDGDSIQVSGTVSVVLSQLSEFYIQDPLRSCGIQVRASSLPTVGASLIVSGTVATDVNTGEMYIQASSTSTKGSATAKPLGVNSRTLGGASFARQQGVYQGQGLNNTGLLVRLHGKVTAVTTDTSYIYISDGTSIDDGSGNTGIKVDLSGLQPWQRPTITVGDKLSVTGASSIYVGSDGRRRGVILVGSASAFTNLDDNGNRPRTIRVMVINFDPIIEYKGGKRLHEIYWPTHAPLSLAQGYINDLKECSGNWANYQIAEWVDADYFPIKTDGFQYTDDSFCYAWEHGGPWHSPDSVDYMKVLQDKYYNYNNPRTVVDRITSGDIDEVWMFGAPYFGYWESCMAGTTPYFVNGGTFSIPQAKRNFIIMGFNYERYVGEMLEDYGHRWESIMTHVYGSWNAYPPQHNWDKFSLLDKNITDHTLYTAGCGNVHFAPNSTADYQWGNYTYVWSTCDDWLNNWPNLKGTKRQVNTSEWGYGDIRLHHKWWFKHFPNKPGVNPDGKQNNWWKYVADFNSYAESR